MVSKRWFEFCGGTKVRYRLFISNVPPFDLFKLSEAFYADAVRRVNLLTLAFALYFPAFERLRATRSLALFLTQPFLPLFTPAGLVAKSKDLRRLRRRCGNVNLHQLRPNAPVNPYAA